MICKPTSKVAMGIWDRKNIMCQGPGVGEDMLPNEKEGQCDYSCKGKI